MKNNYFIVISVICVIYVIMEVRKNSLSIKESFWWFIGSIVMLILSIFPKILDGIALKLNIAYPPSLLFVICIVFLLFINLRDSKRIGQSNEKIIELGQQVSLLKNKIETMEKKHKGNEK